MVCETCEVVLSAFIETYLVGNTPPLLLRSFKILVITLPWDRVYEYMEGLRQLPQWFNLIVSCSGQTRIVVTPRYYRWSACFQF